MRVTFLLFVLLLTNDLMGQRILLFDKENNMIDIKGDEYDVVVGWLSTDQVAKVIAVVQSAKTVDEIKLKCQSLNL